MKRRRYFKRGILIIFLERKLNPRKVEIKVSGKSLLAREGETVMHALWAEGRADEIQTGCVGGVCGACTATVRFPDGRQGGSDLACLRLVEEGMEVFPYPIDAAPSAEPVLSPDVEKLRQSFPTLDRCTKCESCTKACPMGIPVMESVLRMQKGEFDAVADDFITCIHCGLCRFVCEDRVKPHNMGLWVRRSQGMTRSHPELSGEASSGSAELVEREWDYLLNAEPEVMLERAKAFREKGRVS